ncbi:hypothetical protein PQX77_007637, partial [Marasmius sp. AFHP31]
MSGAATGRSCGTGRRRAGVGDTREVSGKTQKDRRSASTGNGSRDAQLRYTPPSMSVQDVASTATELRAALSGLSKQAATPLRVEAWGNFLLLTGLESRYLIIVQSIHLGFNMGIPPITETYSPPNKIITPEHIAAFNTVAGKELQLRR